ncbi:putative phosphoglycerate mutase [Knoellia remsis]|uniref:Putative phosphoglycerate mutase n=1 Tax=Knoellia remsis TaxID=407159 RepID=A0A2T0UY96_9MICO|nr:putative phosphoglycerate mutase [Knoellia remsis]
MDVSDLHCPATLLIARHGDADYPHARVLSDEGGWLTEKGQAQVRDLAESVRWRNIAAVCTSRMQRAVESGAVAAEVLGVQSRVVEGLEEFSVGALAGREHDDPELLAVFEAWKAGDLGTFVPGGESGQAVLDRYREALQEIADLHRGESVLVFSHGGVMSFALPRMGANVRADLAERMFMPNCAVAEVAVDADGIVVRSWPGSADRSVV